MARESWHPRWHAYLDRIEIPVRRVTPDFQAVDVPLGHHAIAFRFGGKTHTTLIRRNE